MLSQPNYRQILFGFTVKSEKNGFISENQDKMMVTIILSDRHTIIVLPEIITHALKCPYV